MPTQPPIPAPVPVLCDRCRAEGTSLDEAFAGFGALLDFEPVPRKGGRVDGWDAERQRAFIAALAACGSKRRAAAAVGRAAFGVDQLLKARGNQGFVAAVNAALDYFAGNEAIRLAEGIGAVAEAAAAAPRAQPWAQAATRRAAASASAPLPLTEREEDEADEQVLALIEQLLRSYMMKLEAERRCRLEGRIAEADFYIRQVTVLEVSLEAMTGDPMRHLKAARFGEHDLLRVANTTMSTLLDAARRDHWRAAGEPERPQIPDRLLRHHDGYATEPLYPSDHRPDLAWDQRHAYDEARYAEDARAQVAWEEQARAQAALWRRRLEADPFGLGSGDGDAGDADGLEGEDGDGEEGDGEEGDGGRPGP